MDDFFDVHYEDAQQIKKDDFVHSFTSFSNLDGYCRSLRAAGNSISSEQKDEAKAWLLEHSLDLPSELFDKDGLPRHAKSEWPESGLRGDDEFPEFTTDDDLTLGLYYVGDSSVCESLESMARTSGNKNIQREYLRNGMTHELRKHLLKVRGERYAKHAEEQARRARWRGMEEWDAVAKADDKLREGASLSAGASTAVQLPSVERLRELFSVEDGELVWAVSRGTVAKGSQVRTKQVQVDGSKFTVKRVVYKLVTGDDPQSAAVSDDLSLNKYRVRGGCTAEVPRVSFDNQFDALVRIGGELVKVGVYKTEAQAKAAADIYIRSMEMGLRE